MKKKLPEITSNSTMFCAGCGHGVLLRLIGEVLTELGQDKNVITAIGVGCSCHLKTGISADLVQAPHGRAAAVATGIRRAEPSVTVFTYQGDGDAYNIGIAETLNAAYRNEKICVFVVNNGNFGMTGGQLAWTALEGQKTTTSPMGRNCKLTGYPIKVPELLADNFNVAYVARGAITSPAEINKLKNYIRNAFEAQLNGEGYSLVEVMSTCPTNWGLEPISATKRLVETVIPYYKLGEFKMRGGN
ncbi:MAG: thiamine pyrophosphate-dependent enzyme [Clostridiaceae bacterium]